MVGAELLGAESYPIKIDVTEMMGYPLEIELNEIFSQRPLSWRSFSHGQLIHSSGFLEAPGIPMAFWLPGTQLEALPVQVRDLVQSIPDYQFELLQAILQSQGAWDLALSSPWLFLLLVIHAQREQMSEQQFKRLVLQKRKTLLDVMVLPTSKLMIRVLAELPLKMSSHYEFYAIRRVMADHRLLAMLRHVRHPSIPHFMLLGQPLDRVWPGMLNMVNEDSTQGAIKDIVNLVRDCIRLGVPANQLDATRTMEQLRTLHDQAVRIRNQAALGTEEENYQALYGDYPAPPLPGDECVVPLKSWDELVSEGRMMHHCVGSYGHAVATGREFVYRVEAGQRLTLSIARTGVSWRIAQLKGYCNATADKAASQRVREWFEWALAHATTGQKLAHQITSRRIYPNLP